MHQQLKIKTGVHFGWEDLFVARVLNIDALGKAKMVVFVKTMKK